MTEGNYELDDFSIIKDDDVQAFGQKSIDFDMLTNIEFDF